MKEPKYLKCSMADHRPIIVRLQGHIAVITLNRPDQLNALGQDHYYQLGETLRQLEKNPDINITILTGTGRYFSA